jgi:DNA polymerase-1
LTRTALIDGDTLVFEAASAFEYETQWDENLWTLHADLLPAVEHLDKSLRQIQEGLDADRVIIALSCEGPRWRNEIMPEYKNHRKKTRKPVVYRPLRQWCHEVHEVFERPTLEGDDVLGILATHPNKKLFGEEKIVVAIDKDMKTIPGLHLNYQHARDTGLWDPYVIDVATADRYHLFQTLTGDSTDGYKGCPGAGPVKAEKILGDKPSWENVVAAYKQAGLNEAAALQNARVARICRASDYDFKKREVIPWVPTAARVR